MSSERAAPFAPKPPEGWDEHVRKMDPMVWWGAVPRLYTTCRPSFFEKNRGLSAVEVVKTMRYNTPFSLRTTL